MSVFKLVVILTLSFSSSVSFARSRSETKASRGQDHVSLMASGITLHGVPNGPDVGQYMPRRLDSSGQLVATPGFGIFYQHKSWLFEAAYLKDCYDHKAIPLLVGRQWKFNRMPNLKVAVLGGVYIRDNPDFCTDDYCVHFNDFGPLPRFLVNDKRTQIFPFVTAQLNYLVPLNDDADLQFSLSSNLIINQLTVGFRFRVPSYP
jgi:hypothetical protein